MPEVLNLSKQSKRKGEVAPDDAEWTGKHREKNDRHFAKVYINSYFSLWNNFWSAEITQYRVMGNTIVEYYGIIWKYYDAALEQ